MYATQNCKNSIHIFFRFKQKKFLLSYGQTGAKEFKKKTQYRMTLKASKKKQSQEYRFLFYLNYL